MEIWKDILGFEGLYQISNFGNVKSLNYRRTGLSKILSPGISNHKYFIVVLCKNKIKKTKMIHQLVSIHFLEHKPCGYKLVINHKDFNRQNNHVDNLEITTVRNNTDKKHLKSTSNFTGVIFNRFTKKWNSSIIINGKKKYLGTFNNEKEASEYYEKALISHNKGEEIEVKRYSYTSKYKGVSWNKSKNKWEVYKSIDGKSKYLGCFIDEIDAYNCYLKN